MWTTRTVRHVAPVAALLLAACADRSEPTAPTLQRSDAAWAMEEAGVAAIGPGMVLGPVPGKGQSQGHDINNNKVGTGVSFSGAPNLDGRITMWPGPAYAPIDLGVPPGMNAAVGLGINDLLHIAGTAYSGAVPFGFFYAAGVYTVLLGPPGTVSLEARDLNNADMVVGSMTGGVNRHAFTWSPAGGYLDIHPAGPYTDSHAEAINNNNTVTGWVQLPNGNRHGARWQLGGGGFLDLGLLPAGGTQVEPQDISDSGIIGGRGGASPWIPFVWRPGIGYTTAPNANTSINGVSSKFRMVGYTQPAASTRAFTRLGGGAAGILPQLGGSTGSVANGVNTCGDIIGTSMFGGPAALATLWLNSPCDP